MTQQQEMQAQAGKFLGQFAGFVGVKTVQMGIRTGLLEEIGKHSQGITSKALAHRLEMDELYVDVWCRAAYSNEFIELGVDETYTLAPFVDQLFLNQDFPGFVGGIPNVLDSPEMFGTFEERFKSGQRMWWDETSHDFIRAVSGTGRPFYTRLIPNGLNQIDGLEQKLNDGAAVAELASGAGIGLVRLAHSYPAAKVTGVDGDRFSLTLAGERVEEHNLDKRVNLEQSTLEGWSPSQKFDVVFINISMHECRDIEKVTQNVHDSLNPGGYFVISDFPFPEKTEDTRTVPARIMCGIQFFEAQIDDQLLPTSDYVDLLKRNGFTGVGAIDMTPVHVVVHGRRVG